MNLLSIRIKEMRQKKDMTLADVAKRLGVSDATVQRYESGEIKNLKYETIVSLAGIYGCSPAYLMGWEVQTRDELTDRALDIFNSLPEDKQQQALDYMRFLTNTQDNKA